MTKLNLRLLMLQRENPIHSRLWRDGIDGPLTLELVGLMN